VADFLDGKSTPGRAGAAAAGAATGAAVAAASNRTDRAGDAQSRGENRTDRAADAQSRGENRANRQPARVANQGERRSSLADGRGERRTERQQDLGKNADQLRDGLRDHYGDGQLYDNFWGGNFNDRYHFGDNPIFWSWAAFNTVQAFLPWNWNDAIYYDYGTGGNIYYEEDTVYIGETTVPADEYADQVANIVENAPEVENPDAIEWLPLGVFTLTEDGNPDAVPNMFLQLALSKEGLIGGTYQNKSTNKTESIEGMVDQKSQRAALTIAGKNSPILETGMANLTMNETRVLAHFADGQIQQWLMVRVENPQAAAQK
jgi:hypothetical protein